MIKDTIKMKKGLNSISQKIHNIKTLDSPGLKRHFQQTLTESGRLTHLLIGRGTVLAISMLDVGFRRRKKIFFISMLIYETQSNYSCAGPCLVNRPFPRLRTDVR
jgi:hypothetical protein